VTEPSVTVVATPEPDTVPSRKPASAVVLPGPLRERPNAVSRVDEAVHQRAPGSGVGGCAQMPAIGIPESHPDGEVTALGDGYTAAVLQG
jgi:hypothetical protein